MDKKYKELYNFCQQISSPPHVGRKVICNKAQELTGKQVKVQKMGMDTQIIRGLFISSDSDSPLARQAGGANLVIIGRGQEDEWDRLIEIKETMHLFDDESEMTSNAEVFEGLLASITVPMPEDTPQVNAEFLALYMALACMCPEKARQQYIADYAKGHIDHYGIALQLRIPAQFVPGLLYPHFADFVQQIWMK